MPDRSDGPQTPVKTNGRPIDGITERIAQDIAAEPIIRAYLRRVVSLASPDESVALLWFGCSCLVLGLAVGVVVGRLLG